MLPRKDKVEVDKPSNHKQVINLIKSLTGQANVLTIPRVFMEYTGSLDAALFLSQILYWSDKGDEEGWFYKTYLEWKKELCLGEYEIRKSIKLLRDDKGIIETKIKKANGNPTLHFRLKIVEFSDSFLEFLQKPTFENSRNEGLESEPSLTETTTEITTETHAPDYLDSILAHTGNPDNVALTSTDDQWLRYRDKALDTYEQKAGPLGRTAQERQTRKEAIVMFANGEGDKFDVARWEQAITESIQHGVAAGNVARFIEVYKFGSYDEYLKATYPKDKPDKPNGPGLRKVDDQYGGYYAG